MNDRHYCASCTTLVGFSASTCGWCDAGMPDGGWPKRDALADPWLGRTIRDGLRVVQKLVRPNEYRVVDILGRTLHARFRPVRAMTAPSDWPRRLRRLRSFENRHLPRLLDVYEQDGHALFVSDFPSGEVLTSRVSRRANMAPAVALEITRQLALALAELHDADLEYGAIDPAGVFVGRRPRGGVVATLSDFGVAEERAFGRRVVSTPAEDVRGLGVLLAYMLVGDGHGDIELAPSVSALVPELEGFRAIDALLASLFSDAPELRPANARVAAHMVGSVIVEEAIWRLSNQVDDIDVPARPAARRLPPDTEEFAAPARRTDGFGDDRLDTNSFELSALGEGRGKLTCVAMGEDAAVIGTSSGLVGLCGRKSRDVFEVLSCDRPITAVAFDEETGLTMAGTEAGDVYWGSRPDRLVLLASGRGVKALALSAAASRFLVLRDDSLVEVFSGLTPPHLDARLRLKNVEQVAFSGDGTRLLVRADGRSRAFDAETGGELRMAVVASEGDWKRPNYDVT